MESRTQRDQNKVAYKVPMITEKDAKEYEGIKAGLIGELKKLGSYAPEIDDLHIDAIARATIHLRNAEKLLESEKANKETYSRVTDAQAKLRKIIESALHELAVTRRERIATQAGKAGEEELARLILEALKNRPK
jgi:vacuolar-type H+-ATPase subunit H